MFVETLLALMLEWKVPEESAESKLARWRPLVTKSYSECKKYEKRTGVTAETCAALSVNKAYWETGLQAFLQLEPKTGPSGEECFFQLHRTVAAVPFDEWRPVHEYGTRHGPDYTRCVEDGVRVLSYHLWRCNLTEQKLRGGDGRAQIWHLYSEYYIPSEGCRIFRGGAVVRASYMGRRLLKKMPLDEVRPAEQPLPVRVATPRRDS
jgi:hypothetical protein